MEKAIRGEYDFSNPQWRHVSERVKNLIEKLLVVDADERLTSREAFEHPWIQKKRVMQASSPSSNKMKDMFLSIDKYEVFDHITQILNRINHSYRLYYSLISLQSYEMVNTRSNTGTQHSIRFEEWYLR